MARRVLPLLLAPLVVALAACATTPPTVPAQTATPGVTATATPPPTPSATPSTTPGTGPSTPAPDEGTLVLRGNGIGDYSFGAKQADVNAVLEDQLGEPEESTQGIGCELDPSSPWGQTVSWGNFWVQYNAKDRSRKAPRTLSAWGFLLEGAELPEPLSLADDVPLDATFAELKAAYPKGRTEDFGLGDGSKRFILPNKIFFVGAGERPMHVQAGAFGLCE